MHRAYRTATAKMDSPTRLTGLPVSRGKTRRAQRIAVSRPGEPAAQEKKPGVAAGKTGGAAAAPTATTAYLEEDESDGTAYLEEYEFDNGPDLDESLDGTESGHEFWSPTIPAF